MIKDFLPNNILLTSANFKSSITAIVSYHTEEVGQLIRRMWANVSTNQIAPFSSCSHEASVDENLHTAHKYRFFSYFYAIFSGKFHSMLLLEQSITHWSDFLKGKRHFPVYFDLSLRRNAVAM